MQDTVVLERDDVRRALARIAHEIVEKNPGGKVALVGVHTRGAYLARRLRALVSEFSSWDIPIGEVDISFYRDDLSRRGPEPIVHSSSLDFPLEGATVVLVDDVLYTGRTVRAGMEALFDYGRPAKVQLAVLVDRGHHELPISPDYVGKNMPTADGDRINVRLDEQDGADEVTITAKDGPEDGPSAEQAVAEETQQRGET